MCVQLCIRQGGVGVGQAAQGAKWPSQCFPVTCAGDWDKRRESSILSDLGNSVWMLHMEREALGFQARFSFISILQILG